MAASRMGNATKNLKVAVVCKLGLFGMAFIACTMFIRILGAEYTGVSSSGKKTNNRITALPLPSFLS